MTTSPHHESPWTGRHDGDGPEHARWHQAVQVVASGADGAAAEGKAADGAAAGV